MLERRILLIVLVMAAALRCVWLDASPPGLNQRTQAAS